MRRATDGLRRFVCRPMSVVAGLCLLLTAGGALIAHAQSPPTGIIVTGQGSASVPADEAIVVGSVENTAATASDALAQNAPVVQAVVAAAKSFLAGEDSVQATNLNVYRQYSQPQPYVVGTPMPTVGSPQITGYEARTGIQVTTTQLDKLGDLLQALVNAGMNRLGGVQFTLQNPEELRTEALQAAIDDAKTQAQAAADRLGVALGAVVNVQVGYSSAPSLPYPAATAVPSVPPDAKFTVPPVVAPGPLTANTSVTITFAIATPTPAQ